MWRNNFFHSQWIYWDTNIFEKTCPKRFFHVPINSLGMEKNCDEIKFFIPNEYIGTRPFKKNVSEGIYSCPNKFIGNEKKCEEIIFFIPNEFIGTRNFQNKDVQLNSSGINVISLGPNLYRKLTDEKGKNMASAFEITLFFWKPYFRWFTKALWLDFFNDLKKEGKKQATAFHFCFLKKIGPAEDWQNRCG